MNTKLTIRPYARLLTMLGDQLIKNEQIAVVTTQHPYGHE